jgi:hypothetical protein
MTEDERKDLIQLLLYFLHLCKYLQNLGSLELLELDEDVNTNIGQIGECNGAPKDTGASVMDGGNNNGSDHTLVE